MRLYQLSDEEALAHVEGASASDSARRAFENLTRLLGDRTTAIRALKEENRFINEHPGLPFGRGFADFVRRYLASNRLRWTQENLWEAAKAERKSRRMGRPA